jgi:sodium-independent sulfate anion transporter 11
MNKIRQARDALSTDHTLLRVRRDGARAARALPSSSVNYIVDKAPVVQWLPKYNPRWILNDALAGLTVGALLIPQGLAYAKIATIPGEFGLMSSWLPAFIYFFMGTSKGRSFNAFMELRAALMTIVDMSTGPTSLMGLLTAEIIEDVSSEGYSPQAIASAVAMCVGIYSLIIGLFRLGFLLEFVSIPVLHGFISATGIVIMLGQIPSLFGVKVGTGTAKIIHDLFAQIPDFKPATIGIGFGSLFLLVALEKIGAIWGKKHKAIWGLALARSFIVLVLFTGISYGVNKDIDLKTDDPVWELSKVKSNGINAPVMPDSALIGKVFTKSIAPFIAATIEHLAIAKSFSRKNGYTIDAAQELVYLGITNFFNSFFSAMPVGGAMSRTAVNSATGVKSPASGLMAGAFVVLAIFKLSPALFWIPKATLAAIIVTAVLSIISSPSVFYKYWKTSLVDFTASMIAFWVTLFAGTEIGIGSAVGFNIAYFLLFWAFARTQRMDSIPVPPVSPDFTNNKELKDQLDYYKSRGEQPIPSDAQIFKPTQSLIFLNAYHVKQAIFDTIQTHNAGTMVTLQEEKKDRSWSVSGARRLTLLRRRAGIPNGDGLTQIRVVVLDFSMVETIDTTGLTALKDFKEDLETFAGESVEIRFLGVRNQVREYFERFGWALVDQGTGGEENEMGMCMVYGALGEAVWARRREESNAVVEQMLVGSEKA